MLSRPWSRFSPEGFCWRYPGFWDLGHKRGSYGKAFGEGVERLIAFTHSRMAARLLKEVSRKPMNQSGFLFTSPSNQPPGSQNRERCTYRTNRMKVFCSPVGLSEILRSLRSLRMTLGCHSESAKTTTALSCRHREGSSRCNLSYGENSKLSSG